MTTVRQFEVIPRLSEGLGKTWTAGSSQTANGSFAPRSGRYPESKFLRSDKKTKGHAGIARHGLRETHELGTVPVIGQAAKTTTVLDDLDAFPKVVLEQAASELYVTIQ